MTIFLLSKILTKFLLPNRFLPSGFVGYCAAEFFRFGYIMYSILAGRQRRVKAQKV